MSRALTSLALIFFLPLAGFAKPATIESEICIYGATSGGVVAAVQSSNLGKSVLLVEPTQHLGGMSAGGLGFTDFGQKEAVGGLARDFYVRVGKKYGKEIEFNLEPHVAEQVFEEWIQHDRIKILRGRTITALKKDGKTITQATLDDGQIIRAKIFLDATYEGDLLPLAGVAYIVGRESNATYGETINGIQTAAKNPRAGKFSIQPDPYLTPGDRKSGLLPLIDGSTRGEIGSADARVQAYNYRLCLTDNSENRRPIDPSPQFDPKKFELVARWIEARLAKKEKLSLSSFLKYDALPNHKFDFNNRWPISTDFMGQSEKYPEATWSRRREIALAHENYLRDFLHFLAVDPRVPAKVREEASRFGLAKDEFTQSNNWPHQLYVREARRMISDLVMREQHCTGALIAPNPVALGCYNIDIHGTRRIVVDGKIENEGSNGVGVPKPYPIGYGALVPRESEATNLFVPFCLSASHVGFASIRMEPVFMELSQASAIAACMAIDANVPVQKVNYEKLREALLKAGMILEWTAPASQPAK